MRLRLRCFQQFFSIFLEMPFFWGTNPPLVEAKKCRVFQTPQKKLKISDFTKIWLGHYVCDVFSRFLEPFLKALFLGSYPL